MVAVAEKAVVVAAAALVLLFADSDEVFVACPHGAMARHCVP